MKEITKLIDAYWKFDEQQQPMSSWHDKQDLLKEVEKKLETLVNQEAEKRIAERMPKPKEAKEKRDNRSGSYLNPRSAMSFDTGFDYAYNWLRSCLVSQKTEGGGE